MKESLLWKVRSTPGSGLFLSLFDSLEARSKSLTAEHAEVAEKKLFFLVSISKHSVCVLSG